MLLRMVAGAVADQPPGAHRSRQLGFRHAVDQLLGAQTVLDDLLDRDDLDLVPTGEADEVGQARHLAVALHDLADHRAWLKSSEAAEVDRGLGLTGPHQGPAFAGAQRKHMPGLDQVICGRMRVHQHLHRTRAIRGRDAGRDAGARLNRDREGRSQRGRVGALIDHQPQAQPVEDGAVHRDADQAATVGRHEVDRLRRHELRRQRQVSFVLAILVVGDDQRLAQREGLDCLFHRRERGLPPSAAACAPGPARLRWIGIGRLAGVGGLGFCHRAPPSLNPRAASRSSNS